MADKEAIYRMLGATNHSSYDREQDDYYATDPTAVELLLDEETFSKNIWECACGGGHISEVLVNRGYNVFSSDIVNRGYDCNLIDFLNYPEDEDNLFDGDIITNPPYKYAKRFVDKAIHVVSDGHKVAMLLRLQFLEGKERRKLFDEYPPKYIYVSSSRINCCRNGDFSIVEKGGASAIAYAWFVWEKSFKGEPTVRWFN